MAKQVHTIPRLRFAEADSFYIGALIVVVFGLLLRFSMFRYQSNDFTVFLEPWYAYIHHLGFHAFKFDFSNYNLPYLYLLYIANICHVPAIVAVKSISVVFDLILSYSVFLVMRIVRPNQFRLAIMAALATFFLPTVWLNSAAWGQCDSIFTTFILLSLHALLKGRSLHGWLWWTVALIFKLQAIFFLPFLIFYWLIHGEDKPWHPLVTVPVFFVPFLPAMLAGRSFASILSIYFNQAGMVSNLAPSAPNIYQWISKPLADAAIGTGLLLTAGVVSVIVLWGIQYRQKLSSGSGMVLYALLILLVIPFLLPQMRERYFYPAEICALITSFMLPRAIWVAVLVETVGVFSYLPLLFGKQPPVPLGILALVQLLNVGMIGYLLITDYRNNEFNKNNATRF